MLKLFISTIVGVILLIYVTFSYSQKNISSRGFLLSLFISAILIFAPLEYTILTLLAAYLGFYYTYVLVFMVVDLFLFIMVVFTIKKINELEFQTIEIIRELSLLRVELKEKENKGKE